MMHPLVEKLFPHRRMNVFVLLVITAVLIISLSTLMMSNDGIIAGKILTVLSIVMSYFFCGLYNYSRPTSIWINSFYRVVFHLGIAFSVGVLSIVFNINFGVTASILMAVFFITKDVPFVGGLFVLLGAGTKAESNSINIYDKNPND